jgi:hypothetical protein
MVQTHPGASSTKYSYLLDSIDQVTTQSHPNPSLHRIEDLCSSRDPSSLHYNTKLSTVSHRDLQSAMQALPKLHKALTIEIQPLALSLHHIDISSTTPLYGLDIYIYIQNRPKHG